MVDMDKNDDPFQDLETDFPVPQSARPAEPARPKGDEFPEDDEPPQQPRRPLRRSAAAAAPPKVDDDEAFGFGPGSQGEFGEEHGDHDHAEHAADGHHAHGEHQPEYDEGGEFEDDSEHGHGEEEHDEAEEGEGSSRSLPFGLDRGKALLYGGGAAVMLFVAMVGWSFVSPMLGGGAQVAGPLTPTGQQRMQTASDAAPSFASASGGVPRLPSSAPQLPPSEPRQARALAAPMVPQADASVRPVAYEPGRVAPAVDAPRNGDVEKLRGDVKRLEAKLAAFAEREDAGSALASGMSDLKARLESLEARAIAPTTPRPGSEPPAKPRVIPDWSLKGVANGVAWLQGPGGFVEAREGQDVPGIGKVKAISKYQNDYVVMTTDGVVVRK